MFSDAISSISWRWRPSSPRIAAAISGSASVSEAEKNESGAEAVLAVELMKGISPVPQPLGTRVRTVLCGRSESGASEISHHAPMAKLLRLAAIICARYGGMPAVEPVPTGLNRGLG